MLEGGGLAVLVSILVVSRAAQVLLNPFDDIIPRISKEQQTLNLKKANREQSHSKAVK